MADSSISVTITSFDNVETPLHRPALTAKLILSKLQNQPAILGVKSYNSIAGFSAFVAEN
jgi:hypothetical protein